MNPSRSFLLFLTLVFLIGSSTAAQALTMNCSGLSADKINQLKPSMSSSEVRALLCPEQTTDSPMSSSTSQHYKNGNSFNMSYEMEMYFGPNNSNVAVLYLKSKSDNKLLYIGARSISPSLLKDCEGITEENFEKLKAGMSYGEVSQLLCDGNLPQDMRLSQPEDTPVMAVKFSRGKDKPSITVGFDYNLSNLKMGNASSFKSSDLKREWQKYGRPE